MKLEGRTALVTGAGRGIGRAYALRLAALGADVAVADVDLHSYRDFADEAAQLTADTTAGEVEALGRRALQLEFDVADEDAVRAAVADIVKQWGRLDIAVCNAGGGMGSPAETRASIVPSDMLDTVLRRNLYGAIYTCKAVAEPMKAQRWGRIVTIASIAGQRSMPEGGYAHYGAAKAGVLMYTRALAQELGPFGITANCLAPGPVLTGRLTPMLEKMGMESLVRGIALRRLATPEDCANVLEFLVTNLGDYVTGALIPVDGGAR
jgi:3-oxoacyl-[acyl-carrier protein] reductase